ncbi:hypothetical protein [Methanospirillum sp.]|uniref:hypothetical protein n=1 Tax=Methanospirillum sp. TaxID=45200 RepID=UPI0029837491|nr:hypothetical protein [Methanospirillum sp.]
MTLIEILLIILIILVILFMLFWFFQGTTGRISLRRPVESRVDEYLDRRFARLIEDYEVVRRPKLNRFKDERGTVLDTDAQKIAELKQFENEFTQNLSDLEARLDELEKSFDSKK